MEYMTKEVAPDGLIEAIRCSFSLAQAAGLDSGVDTPEKMFSKLVENIFVFGGSSVFSPEIEVRDGFLRYITGGGLELILRHKSLSDDDWFLVAFSHPAGEFPEGSSLKRDLETRGFIPMSDFDVRHWAKED